LAVGFPRNTGSLLATAIKGATTDPASIKYK